jgi:hypothetical protein
MATATLSPPDEEVTVETTVVRKKPKAKAKAKAADKQRKAAKAAKVAAAAQSAADQTPEVVVERRVKVKRSKSQKAAVRRAKIRARKDAAKRGWRKAWKRFRDFMKKWARKSKRGGRKAASRIKASAATAWAVTKSGAGKVVRAAKTVGNLALRGVGWVGYGISTAIGVAASWLTFGTSVVAGAVIWAASFVIAHWFIFVVGTFLWLLTRDRKGYTKTIKKQRKKVKKQTAAAEPEVIRETVYVDPTDYAMVPDDILEQYADLEERSNALFQMDFTDTSGQFPGATVYYNPEEPYGEGTVFQMTHEGDLGKTFTRWVGAGNKEIDFSFAKWIEDPDLEAVLHNLGGSGNPMFDAYFTGRLEMLRQFKIDPDRLEMHGRAWAQIWAMYKNKQGQYPMKYLRLGVYDMVKDLTEAYPKVKAKQ